MRAEQAPGTAVRGGAHPARHRRTHTVTHSAHAPGAAAQLPLGHAAGVPLGRSLGAGSPRRSWSPEGGAQGLRGDPAAVGTEHR